MWKKERKKGGNQQAEDIDDGGVGRDKNKCGCRNWERRKESVNSPSSKRKKAASIFFKNIAIRILKVDGQWSLKIKMVKKNFFYQFYIVFFGGGSPLHF